MKKLIIILILAITSLTCTKQVKSVQQELPRDIVLENPTMDIASKKPNTPHNPHNPVDPPVVTPKTGCLLIDINGHDENSIWGNLSLASGGVDDKIVDILSKVKGYYTAFNVEVTTDEAIYNTYPQNKRRRCVVTTTNFYGNVGGVAYLNSFNWFDNTSCFVFSQLLQYNAKYIADAIAHEFGHTFGCRHAVNDTHFPDGSCVYNGEYLVGWDIMGNSYASCCPIFEIVETGCGVTEDEPQIINNSINQ